MWYSFNYGLVHFVQLSTETDFDGAPEGPSTYLGGGPFGNQTDWLLNDLKAANAPDQRAQRPWIIVSGHRPFYSSASGRACDACIKAFEPLFLEYGVDVYLSGHVHWYERLYAIVDGKVTNKDYTALSPGDGPVHLVNGAAGNVEGHSTGSQGDLSAFLDDSHYGYSILRVDNASTLNWQFFNADDRSLIDQVTIVRQKH
jgi:acid phosphatase